MITRPGGQQPHQQWPHCTAPEQGTPRGSRREQPRVQLNHQVHGEEAGLTSSRAVIPQVSSTSSDHNLRQQGPLIADQNHNDQTGSRRAWEISGQLEVCIKGARGQA